MRYAGAMFAAFGAELVEREGRGHGRFGRGAAGAGIRAEAGEVPAGRCGQLRRCLEQPGADLRQERADLEPALGLGGRQARCAAGRGGLLDVPGAEGAEGPVHAAGCRSSWGIWQFSKNKAAAKELIEYLLQREQVEERDNRGDGYDVPPFVSMTDFTIWAEVEPPKGTVYNYPIRK